MATSDFKRFQTNAKVAQGFAKVARTPFSCRSNLVGKVTNLLPVLTVEKYSASKYILSFSTDISLGITKQKPVVDSPERGNETSDPINGSEFYDERLIGLLHRF